MSALQDEIRRNGRQGFPAELAEPSRCRPRFGECDDAAHEVFRDCWRWVRRQRLNHDHAALVTDRALPQGSPGEFFMRSR